MKIGIVVGSIREGRFGRAVGDWVHAQAQGRSGAAYEVVDLKDFQIPLLTSATPPGMAKKTYDSPEVTRWSQAIDACDAYVFVTPEYNHGVPGAFKNAFDSLGDEWLGKPIAFVGYGFDGGVRAVEQWRQIVANFQMLDVRAQLALSLIADAENWSFAPTPRRAAEVATLFDSLEGLVSRLAG